MRLLTERAIFAILQRLEKALDEEKPDLSDIGYEALGITKTHWKCIMIMLSELGFIAGATKIPDGNSKIQDVLINDARITVKGKDYLAQCFTALKILRASKEFSILTT